MAGLESYAVIFGGLVGSTLLDFFVHSALFWLFGREQVEGQMAAEKEDEWIGLNARGQDWENREACLCEASVNRVKIDPCAF